MTAIDVGRFGVWSSALRVEDEAEALDAAAELDELGYGAIWLPGRGDDVFVRAGAVLGATGRIAVATGIVNVWRTPAEEAAREQGELQGAHPGRFLLGLGISHGPLVEEYRTPLRVMGDYLDELDQRGVPRGERALAALAPRMLELARDRSAGSHTYLVPVEHTRRAREALGPDALLAVEVGVVLEPDPARARSLAQAHLETYLRFPNYVNNWFRSGFSEADAEGGCSDRLVDALVAWGDPAAIARRVEEHHEAGADHVCVQVLTQKTQSFHREAWRELAGALLA
jgi:probable F420-dependent oxidoreductase